MNPVQFQAGLSMLEFLAQCAQIDDACLGGERNGGKPGRDSENKQAFLIAVETDENLEHPRHAVIAPLVDQNHRHPTYASQKCRCEAMVRF